MNATYLVGTDENVVMKVECTRTGYVFDPSEWTAKAALCPVGTAFDDAKALWADAILTTVGTEHFATTRIGDLLAPVIAGRFRALVRATHTGSGYETPLLRSNGLVIIEEP